MAEAIDLKQARRRKRPGPTDSMEFRRSELCTEYSGSRVFANACGSYVRFVSGWGWLAWTGTHWACNEAQVRSMCIECVGQHFRDLAGQYARDGEPTQLVSWLLAFARKCETAATVSAILKISEAYMSMTVAEFDVQPLKVNFKNCTLDFGNPQGSLPKVLDHGKSDYITKCIPYDYYEGKPAPTWERFLEDIFPSPALRHFVKKAAGYSLLGTSAEQVFFICFGKGRNGKSTFLNVLQRIMGDGYAGQCPPELLLDNRPSNGPSPDLAKLYGLRFLTSIETGEGHKLNEARVKAMCGGDPIVARELYQSPFQFEPTHVLWLATNDRPKIKGTDLAIWRRVRLIPFTQTIPEDRVDGQLKERLISNEAEGVLNWLVEGACAYLAEGLKAPEEVTAATSEYRLHEDGVGRFLAECCLRQSHCQTLKADVYAAYEKWCADAGETAVSKRRFGEYLQSQGFDEYRATGGKRLWIGLGILTDE